MKNSKLKINNMVRLFLTVLLFAFPVNAYSQQQIEGFWNVKLGERESTVISLVKKLYPNAKFDNDIVGNPFRVRKPHLAGIEMDVCEFSFSNNIFVKAEFAKGDGEIIPEYELQSFASKTRQDILPYFSQLVESMSSKYGTPMMSGDSYIWRTSNGNSITIKSKSFTERDEFLYGNGIIIRKSKNLPKPIRKVQNPLKIGQNHNSKGLLNRKSRNIIKH